METKNLKYFTKYLPVEGEIKEGDKYLFANRILSMTKEIIEKERSYLDMSDEELSNMDIREGRRIKVKLFLCSRDNPKQAQEILTEGIKEGQEFSEQEKNYLTLSSVVEI